MNGKSLRVEVEIDNETTPKPCLYSASKIEAKKE